MTKNEKSDNTESVLSPIKRKDGNKRVIAWVADLHTLCNYALAPRKFKCVEGNELQLNDGQRELLRHYEAFIQQVNTPPVADTICVVGDAIHGQNYREMGIQLMSTNLDDQVNATVELLKPLVKGKRLFMWSGSGYHRSTKGHNPEMDVCNHKDLVGVAESTHWMGPISNMIFAPSKKIFNIHHGVSSAYIYRTMLMDREALFMREAEALSKIPKVDVIIRGHWHKFIHIHQNQKHSIQLPCWQMFVPWRGGLLSYGKMQPDIGGVITVLDNADRLKVWHFLYSLPHICDDVLMV